MSEGRSHPATATTEPEKEQFAGMESVQIHSPRAYGCRAWGGCKPGDRCPEHRDAEPQQLGGLVLALLADLRPDRPPLYLVKGGKR